MTQRAEWPEPPRAVLQGLASLLPALEASTPEDQATFDGGGYSYGPELERFLGLAGSGHFSLEGWDYTSSIPWAEALLREDPAGIAQLSLLELRRLGTILCRGERFSGGYLRVAYKSGAVVAILQRIAAIMDITRKHD